MLINKDMDEEKNMMEELIFEDMAIFYRVCDVVKRKWVKEAYSSIMSSQKIILEGMAFPLRENYRGNDKLKRVNPTLLNLNLQR